MTQQIVPSSPSNADIWSILDIAAFYVRSVADARRKTRRPDFPPPTNGDKGRWWAKDVRAYARICADTKAADKTVLRHSVKPVGRIVRRDRLAAAA